MSGMPAPAASPAPTVMRPAVVAPRPQKPRRRGIWIVLILIAALCGTIYLALYKRVSPRSRSVVALAGIRTAVIAPGSVERTLRLAGSTAAANYRSLIAPRLIGSRSDHGRDLSAAVSTSAAASTASSSSSTSSVSTSAPNASSAFTAATSRLGTTTPASGSPVTAPSASSSSSTTGSTSTAMGSSGLGSTYDSLPGAAPGGSGVNDFMLILQKVAAAGSLVHKGNVVAEFDRQYMLLRVDDYKASVVESEDSLKKRQADLEASHKAHDQLVDAARGALDKARLDLKTIPVLSEIDAARARLADQQADAKYRQLLQEVPFVLASERADTKNSELDLEQSKLELKRAEANVNKMIYNAPIDGLVVMQSVWRGADLAQFQQGDHLWPGQFFMEIVDPRSMVVNATVNQVDAERVRIGQKARVHFDAYPGLVLPAHVDAVAAMTKPGMFRAQFVKDVAVRVKIDGMDKRVIPDLSASVDIVEESEAHAAAIAPLASIFRDSDSPRPYVWVQTAFGWRRREIEVGIRNNLAAAVNGLQAGEVVALEPPRGN